MAEWGAGSFTPGVYDKTIPGAYVNIRVTPGASYETSVRGYAAAMLPLPGGEDDAIITVTKEEFDKDAEKFFGVPSTHKDLLPVRELFRNAHTLYLYRLNSGGNKASGATGEAKFSGVNGNNITVTVANNVDEENKYDVITYYNGVEKDHQKVKEATDGDITLTKGKETPGVQVKPTFIEKWGFVKSVSELDSIKGLSTKNLPADKENIFYFHLKDQLDNGENYSAIFEVDGSKYALPIWNLKPETRNIYLWLKDDDMSGSFKETEGSWSANTESVDITGKTVKVSLYNYGKKVTAATLKSEPTEKLIDNVEVVCTNSVEKGEVQSGTPASATISFNGDTATVEFSDVPDGFKPAVKIKNGDNFIGFQEGIIEDKIDNAGLKHTIKYYKDADLDGEKTVEAYLVKNGSNLINSCTYTCKFNETATGADVTELVDNDFVSFNKTGLLQVTGGDIYAGGTDGEITGQNYVEAKDLFESVRFNTLALATTDRETQDMFISYVEDCRDVNGIKFQLVIPECPYRDEPINHEGVIQYSSINKVTDENYTDVGLTYWLAGAEAGCRVNNDLTGAVYDGEFEIEARVTRAQQQRSIANGSLLFNKMGNDVVILKDLNTLVDVPKGSELKNDDFKNNQTVRVMDGLAVETADCFNNFFLGKLNNTEPDRAELKNQLIKIRQTYAQIGAIGAYDEALMQIQPGEKIGDIIGSDGVTVNGSMQFLYFTISIIAEYALAA